MENIIICNGSISLVIVPKNEHELEMLKKLSEQNDLELTYSNTPVAVLDKSIKNAFVIKKKSS